MPTKAEGRDGISFGELRRLYALPEDRQGERGLDLNSPHVSSDKRFTVREAEQRVIVAVIDWGNADSTAHPLAVAALEMTVAFAIDELRAAHLQNRTGI